MSALMEDRVLKIRRQSHQVHPTVLQWYTIIYMQYERKYKHISTNESTMHSEMDPVWQNPIQRTKNGSSKCAYDCAQLQYIIKQYVLQ